MKTAKVITFLIMCIILPYIGYTLEWYGFKKMLIVVTFVVVADIATIYLIKKIRKK